MRIDRLLHGRRRGELGMEALLVLPVTLVIIVLARLILEGMLFRQEVTLFTRSSTATAAEAESVLPLYCTASSDPFSERPAVSQTASVVCTEREAEGGLQSQPTFWDALERGAQPYPRMLDDVKQEDALMDMQGTGQGTTSFASPDLLSSIGLMTSSGAALFPEGERWTHEDDPLRSSYDPVLWDALREQGTWRLFPNVFPARDN